MVKRRKRTEEHNKAISKAQTKIYSIYRLAVKMIEAPKHKKMQVYKEMVRLYADGK